MGSLRSKPAGARDASATVSDQRRVPAKLADLCEPQFGGRAGGAMRGTWNRGFPTWCWGGPAGLYEGDCGAISRRRTISGIVSHVPAEIYVRANRRAEQEGPASVPAIYSGGHG